MCAVPCCAVAEPERVFPAFFIDVARHVDVPRLPSPLPTRIRNLGICDVDRTWLLIAIEPRFGVEIEECL
jgi:hypothetical protein